MEDFKQNYPYVYKFLTTDQHMENNDSQFKFEFKVSSKFIKLPFYNKGIGLYKLTPFKNSLPFKLTDQEGNSYRVNKDMYASTDIGDYVVLEYKSQSDFQIPLQMTLYKSHPIDHP